MVAAKTVSPPDNSMIVPKMISVLVSLIIMVVISPPVCLVSLSNKQAQRSLSRDQLFRRREFQETLGLSFLIQNSLGISDVVAVPPICVSFPGTVTGWVSTPLVVTVMEAGEGGWSPLQEP